MTKKNNNNGNLTKEDKWLWRRIIETVTPLKDKMWPAPEEEEFDEEEVNSIEDDIGEALAFSFPKEPEKKKEYKYLKIQDTNGLDKSTARKFKSGKYKISAKLDLHGNTQDEALNSLRYFINKSFESGQRCILVITGRGSEGKGILKEQVPRWLNLPGVRECIISFCQAQPRHGGDGALYVLLRKSHKS